MVKDFVKKIKWLGHDSFLIEAGKNIYIDPYEIQPGPAADIILITHEHFDHCSPEDVVKVQQPGSVVVTEKDSAAKLTGDVKIMAPGDSISVGDVKIEAVPAYNLNKDFHPKTKEWLGFIIEIDGVRIYHAGDTDFIPEMEGLNVDIALLPVSGTYVMTAAEAVEAAKVIRPKIAVPMHYGAIVGGDADADFFKSALENEMDVVVLDKK
jgi:L-ascorbate metabolism protein UlaG (beta-lactamase superfamily)